MKSSPADVTFDMSYASTVLRTTDGREVHVSQGLCAGSCSTLQSLFKVDTDQRVYTLPAQVDSHSLGLLMEWLHGARHSMRLELTYDQAVPVMQFADYLGMQCWADNCAMQMHFPEGAGRSASEAHWLKRVDLAGKFASLDLLMAVLHKLPAHSPISAPRVCHNIQDVKLLQAVFDFFDPGFLTLAERFQIVWSKFGRIPEDLGELCIQQPMYKAEVPWLSTFIKQHNIAMQPALVAKLLDQTHSYAPQNSFPISCNWIGSDLGPPQDTSIHTSTSYGDISIDQDDDVLSIIPLTEEEIDGCVRTRCISSLHIDGKSIAATDICRHCYMLPTNVDLPQDVSVAIIIFSNKYGKNLNMK